MTARLALVLSAAALLGACATAQENPNYQFSTKYDPTGTVVQLADHSDIQTTQVIYETAPVQPVGETYVVSAQEAPQIAVSETEQAFDASTMDGTPGYALFADSASTSEPEPAPMIPQGSQLTGNSRAVSYDYSQNIVVAGADTAIAATEVRPYGQSGAGYTVRPGDTVYSLARTRCVPLNAVTAPNAIGADYAISIGQQIKLPGSRC